MSAETALRCPACGRWLGDAVVYARLVCRICGAEVTWRAKAGRDRPATPPALPRIVQGGSVGG